MINRRRFIGALGAGAATLTLWPGLSAAATGDDSRLLVLLLRGGLDGLHALPPYGDPAYAKLRGALALGPDGAEPALKLDASFALHPRLNFAAQLYGRGEFMPLVAAAPPYWGRSHFDAQDCVENGTDTPHGAQSGWLNRAVAALPGSDGLAIAAVMPLMMRGSASIETWSPPLPLRVNPVLLQRLEPLYGEDPQLAAAFAQALANQGAGMDQAANADMQAADAADPGMAKAPEMQARAYQSGNNALPGKGGAQDRLPALMKAAGGFMAAARGPRVAFVEDYGWDTHANQAAILNRKLKELDDGYAAFHDAIGSAWSKTVVVTVTEFGRTAAINGTNGTDHGTGAALFLAGGAVRGGRAGGQWPGMAPAQLYQQRDIHATTDLRAVFKGVLGTHLGLGEAALAEKVFPGSASLPPLEGLIRA